MQTTSINLIIKSLSKVQLLINILKDKIMDINPTHKTTVKVQITHIKCVNEQNDEIVVLDAHGKLTITDCKNIAKQNELSFVSKNTVTKEHDVLTCELLAIV